MPDLTERPEEQKAGFLLTGLRSPVVYLGWAIFLLNLQSLQRQHISVTETLVSKLTRTTPLLLCQRNVLHAHDPNRMG